MVAILLSYNIHQGGNIVQPLHNEASMGTLAGGCSAVSRVMVRFKDRSDCTPVHTNLSYIIIAIKVQWMYANYAIWDGGLGGSKNDFFWSG